jgi:hypothetical protein
VGVVDDSDQQVPALQVAASSGAVNSEAIPLEGADSEALTRRCRHLRSIADQGTGQGNGQGVTGATRPHEGRS